MFNITVIIWKKIMNMGKTNKCNLRKDETIEEVVKKYQCLYEKGSPWRKERDQCKNAWKGVKKEIGLEEGSYC